MVSGAAGEVPEDIKVETYTHGHLSHSLGEAKLRPMVIKITGGKLSILENTLNMYGTMIFGTTTSFSGMLTNSIFGHCFKVNHDALKTYTSLITLPFLSTIAAYTLLVTNVLYSDNINQENCALRSSLFGIVCGVLYPTALIFSKNRHLTVKLHTVPLPSKGRVLLYWMMLCQTEIKAMLVPLDFQMLFGLYNDIQHYAIFESTFENIVHED